MSDAVTGRSPSQELLAEAAAWHERVTADGAGEPIIAAFEAWKDAAPANASAYEAVLATLALAREAADAPAILALRHQALARATLSKPRANRRAAIAAGLAAVMVGGAGWLALQSDAARSLSPLPRAAHQTLYSTGVGEQMTIRLSDGSTVRLNTASRLRNAYTAAERRLVLESGQAFFQVAKAPTRPFVVVAGDRAIVAHGTEFDVRLDERALQVALLEGKVSVGRDQRGAHDEVRLQPDDVLTARGDSVSVQNASRVDLLAAWRDGMLIFQDARLADAAAEMNRYSERKLVIADAAAGQLRVSGAFRIGETAALVDALKRSFPVVVADESGERIVVKSSAGG
ncbi:FecR domain-containing protein [Phenylobacterium sp. LjRoot219]|uniref:FecR family protein n=1 Tax=Phenylobacterium sp. LjRoot219 TaxID=3342283 RepID=UPI003ECD1549